jgi:hypothetical protein
MSRIGVTSPERLKVVLEVVDYLRNSGFVIRDSGRRDGLADQPTPIFIRNDSGEEIPAFACVQADGTVEAGGQNFIKVVKPTGTSGVFLFNGIAPIEDGKYGIAHDGPECRMLTDGSTVTLGEGWQPESGEWAVTPGGSSFTAIGEDDIVADVMRGVIKSSSSLVCITGVSGIAARAGTTVSSATCTIVNRSGSTISTGSATITVYNLSTTAVGNSVYIVAEPTNIGYVAVWEDC